jgi:hypothetical protein
VTLSLYLGPVLTLSWDGIFQTYFVEVCLPYVLGLSVVRNSRDENFQKEGMQNCFTRRDAILHNIKAEDKKKP